MDNQHKPEKYSYEYLMNRIKELEQEIEVHKAFRDGIKTAQSLNTTWGYAQAR